MKTENFKFINDSAKTLHGFLLLTFKKVNEETLRNFFPNYLPVGRKPDYALMFFQKDVRHYLEKTYFKYTEKDIIKLRLPLKKFKEENNYFGFLAFCISVQPEVNIKSATANISSIVAIKNRERKLEIDWNML